MFSAAWRPTAKIAVNKHVEVLNDPPSPCYGVPGESLRRAESVNV